MRQTKELSNGRVFKKKLLTNQEQIINWWKKITKQQMRAYCTSECEISIKWINKDIICFFSLFIYRWSCVRLANDTNCPIFFFCCCFIYMNMKYSMDANKYKTCLWNLNDFKLIKEKKTKKRQQQTTKKILK